MSQTVKNVTLIGASGSLGTPVLEALLNEPSFNVTILSRPDSKSTFPEGVRVVRAALDDVAGMTKAFEGQDAVVSTIAGISLSSQTGMVDAAVAAGVKRFIPSSFGSDLANEKVRGSLSIQEGKAQINEYLKSASARSGLTWTAVTNGAFFDWGLKTGFLGIDLANHKATIYDDGNARFASTTVATIALAVARILTHLDATANKSVYVSSLVTSQNEIVAALEKAQGVKYEVEHSTVADAQARGPGLLAKGDFEGFVLILRGVLYGGQEYSADYTVLGTVNELLDLPQEKVEDLVKKVVET